MTSDATEPNGADPNASGSMRSLLTESTYYLIGSIANRGIGFLLIPFYARYLSPAEYGLIELVELSTQTIAIGLGLQALGLGLTRLYHDQRTARTRQDLVSTAVMTTALLSAAVTVIAILGARTLSELVFHTPDWTRLLQAAFVAMFLSNMTEVVLVYERIQDRARFFLIFTTLGLLGGVVLNVAFIGFLHAGVWGFIWTKLVISAVGGAYLLARVSREVGWHWKPAYLPEFGQLGVPLVVSSLAFFVFHFSDRFFLAGWVSLADVGRYSLAYKLAMLVSVLTGDAFSKVWEATLFRYTERPDWRADFASVADYLTVALFVTGMGVALFSPVLLRIMVPQDYLAPPLVIPVVVLSYVAREIGDFFRNTLMINKRAGAVLRISVGGAVVNLGTNALFIPFFGVMGAATATLATWTCYMVVCWVVANAEHRLPIRTGAYVALTGLACLFYLGGSALWTGRLVPDALWDGLVLLGFTAATAAFLTPGQRRQVLAQARLGLAAAQARLGGGRQGGGRQGGVNRPT